MGLLNRCLRDRVAPVIGAWDILPPKIRHCEITEDFEFWNSRFPLARRRQQAIARKSIVQYGYKSKASFYRKSFVKRELTAACPCNDCKIEWENKMKDPRIIQGAGNEVNAGLGPWMWAFSKHLSRCWHKFHRVCYASGMTSEDIGEWYDYHIKRIANPDFIESDFSRMDCTEGTEALKFERRVYDTFKPPRLARKALDAQLFTVGFTRSGIMYKISATRKTGDPNTSVGNSILSATTAVELMKAYGVPKTDYAIIVLGDDTVIIKNSAFVITENQVKAHYLRFGFISKPVLGADPRDATFCSQHFWPTADGTILGPKVGRSLCKLGWSVNKNVDVLGVALGLKNNCSAIPVLREYVAAIERICKHVSPIPSPYRISTRLHEPIEETYAVFSRWYGNWEEAERQLKSLTQIPVQIHLPCLDAWLIADNH